jgi:translation initiation factor 2B subunit (eIF-2B alpha/beta/delta family)
VDAVIIGADLIAFDYFINKVGTSAIVAALGSKKKLYIIAPTTKFFPEPFDRIEIGEKPANEVWEKPPQKVKVVNQYFEKIRYTSNMRFVNEYGTWTTTKLKNYLENTFVLK